MPIQRLSALQPRDDDDPQTPRLKAFALRVRDAAAAYEHCVEKGAWPIVPRVGAMELNIPASPGGRQHHLLRRPLSGISITTSISKASVRCCASGHRRHAFFGIVQSIEENVPRWVDFYLELFGFLVCCRRAVFWRAAEGALLKARAVLSASWSNRQADRRAGVAEKLTRVGFGAPDITALVSQLRARRQFCRAIRCIPVIAVPVTWGGTSFEFVQSHLPVG